MRAVEVGDEVRGYAVKIDCVPRTLGKMRMYTDEQCRAIYSTSAGISSAAKAGLVQFFGLKLIALTVAAIVARCSSIAAKNSSGPPTLIT
jgi:hypothetical protein